MNYNLPSLLFTSIAISETGQYQVISSIGYEEFSYGGVWISSDFGQTWTATNSESPYFISTAISNCGRIVMALTIDYKLYHSCDFGLTWHLVNTINLTLNPGVISKQIVISGTGRYQTLVTMGGGLYTSCDFGQTWKLNPEFSTTTGLYFLNASMCASGKIQAVTAFVEAVYFTVILFISNDHGQTWNIANINYAETFLFAPNVSASGQYVSVMGYQNVFNSSDYGNTFTKSSTKIFESGQVIPLSICSSSTCDLMTVSDLYGFIFSCRNYEDSGIKVSTVITENNLVITNGDEVYDYYLVSTIASPVTLTLPEISTLFPGRVRRVTVVDYDSNADNNNITVVCNPNDFIAIPNNENSTSFVLNIKNQNVMFVSLGNKWFIQSGYLEIITPP